ncbi:MAG: DUF285 domain-containing protein [archaeon]|nr:DUF285 domain-containing protein [archaeon]
MENKKQNITLKFFITKFNNYKAKVIGNYFDFPGASNLEMTLNGTSIDFSKSVEMPLGYNKINILFEGLLTSAKEMFSGSEATEIIFNNFNTERITDMSRMFYYCPNLRGLNLSSFNTINVKDMTYFIGGCDTLCNVDLSNFNVNNAFYNKEAKKEYSFISNFISPQHCSGRNIKINKEAKELLAKANPCLNNIIEVNEPLAYYQGQCINCKSVDKYFKYYNCAFRCSEGYHVEKDKCILNEENQSYNQLPILVIMSFFLIVFSIIIVNFICFYKRKKPAIVHPPKTIYSARSDDPFQIKIPKGKQYKENRNIPVRVNEKKSVYSGTTESPFTFKVPKNKLNRIIEDV